jgi:hypothetical protein
MQGFFHALRWTFPTRSAKALKSAHVGAAFVRLVLENRKRLGRRLESGKNAGGCRRPRNDRSCSHVFPHKATFHGRIRRCALHSWLCAENPVASGGWISSRTSTALTSH